MAPRGILRFIDGGRGVSNAAGINGGTLDGHSLANVYVNGAFFEDNSCGQLGCACSATALGPPDVGLSTTSMAGVTTYATHVSTRCARFMCHARRDSDPHFTRVALVASIARAAAIHGFTPGVAVTIKNTVAQYNAAGVHGGAFYVCGGGTMVVENTR